MQMNVVLVLMFQLKPYVSYKVSDVTQSKFTARDLFNSTYAKIITDDFNSGKNWKYPYI